MSKVKHDGRRAALTGLRGLAFCGSLIAMCAVDASARIEVTPTIELRQIFSDEVGDGKAGAYTVVSPGVEVAVNGRRTSAALNYSYDRRLAWQSSTADIQKGAHNLSARADMEVARELLFLSAGGLITSTTRDLRGPVSLNRDLNVYNQTMVYSGYITPSLRQRFGAFADGELSYTLRGLATNEDDAFVVDQRGGNEYDYQLEPASDSYGHSATASLKSGEAFNRLRWTLSGTYSYDKRDVLNETFRSARGTLDGEFVLSRQLSLLGSVGYDDSFSRSDRSYTDTTRVTRYDESGVVFDGGLRWSPSRRTDVSVRVGRRFGSTTVNAQGEWMPLEGVAFKLAYTDSIETESSLLTQQIGDTTVSSLLSGSRYRTGGSASEGYYATQGQSTMRARIGRASISIDRRNWFGGLTAVVDRRGALSFTPVDSTVTVDPAIFENEDKTYGATGNLGRKINARSSWNVSASGYRYEYALSSNRRDWLYGGSVGYSYDLTRAMRATAAYTHSTRTSSVAGYDQSDNSITLGVRASF